MRFFFDRNIAVRLARVIEAYDDRNEIRYHDDIFDKRTPDVHWISELARQGNWTVLGGDARILKNPAEANALQESRLSYFLLKSAWSSLSFHDQAWKLLKIWPDIVRNAEQARAPTLFSVPVSAAKIDRVRLLS